MRFPHSLVLALFFATAAHATDTEDAALFRQLFLEEAKIDKPSATPAQLDDLFFTPDAAVERSLKARTLDESLEALKGASLTSLKAARAHAPKIDAPKTDLKGRRLTIVLVPGVFAEFIKTRAMEEIFEKPSKAREAFRDLVLKAKAARNPNALDHTQLLSLWAKDKPEKDTLREQRIDEVIHFGELSVRGAKVRVLLLATPFGSLESLGDATVRAAMFNRRLEKYLALTGPNQPLAIVGYSRGTLLGLEMLAQAKRDNKPWVKNVKGLVSLAGVVLGSALADDAVKGERSPTRLLLEGVKKTADSLEKYPDDASLAEKGRVRVANDLKWANFGTEALGHVRELTKNQNPFETLQNLAKVDPRAPVGIFLAMWKELGLTHYNVEYNRNIDRFRKFVDELLLAVRELSGDARVRWFRANQLPKNVTYYALPAAMAYPPSNEAEKELFKNPFAYGSGSQDDVMLSQNRKDYETLSGGLALNDSQVSVAQASFPPGVLESLGHPGLKTKFLGVAGTHHWGVALREVNKMRGGQQNGFPREALLRAIAVQVLLDD